MGSKNAPGEFDCYDAAAPDEPIFVLLGRDRHAPALVRQWAERRAAEGEDPKKVAEARACAIAMESYGTSYRRQKLVRALIADRGMSDRQARSVLLIVSWDLDKAKRVVDFSGDTGVDFDRLVELLATISSGQS